MSNGNGGVSIQAAIAALTTTNQALGQTQSLFDATGVPITGTGTPYTELSSFITPIFGAGGPLQSVGQQIHSALKDAATVIAAVDAATNGITNLANASAAMAALQTSLALTQSIAPPGASAAVLATGDGLFQVISALLATAEAQKQQPADAADQLKLFATLLRDLATLFT